ncbi:MAG: 2TM domain-containing protein [Alphaproteobacteria bacterium]
MTVQEEKIRENVRELRSFYTNALIFAGVSALSVLAWLLSGGGRFWPIWVLIGSGLAIGLQAFRLGMMPILEEWFPFLTTEWEEQKVASILNDGDSKTVSTSASIDSATAKIAVKKAK